MNTLVDLLLDSAQRFGRRDAFIFKPGFRTQRWNYSQVLGDSAAIASHLRQQGIAVEILHLNNAVLEACRQSKSEEEFDFQKVVQEQLERCMTAIERANAQNMAVAVHCGAGLGRTGTVLAAYLVSKGASAVDAIARVRRLRPGSVETETQEEAIIEFARRRRKDRKSESGGVPPPAVPEGRG